MTGTVELIILGYTKFSENSVVLHTLSAEYGRRGFMARVGKSSPMALFLPLNILEAQIVENPRSELWRAHGFTAMDSLEGIRSDMRKNAMSLFMSEVLYRTVKDGAADASLYRWCLENILTLNGMSTDFSNFHIRFLLELAEQLGFRPGLDGMAPFADEYLADIGKFLRSDFPSSMLIPLTGSRRTEICSRIIKYLEYHTESSINIRSLAVLGEIFAGEGPRTTTTTK